MGKSVRVLSATAIAVASAFMAFASPAGASASVRLVARPAARADVVPNTNTVGIGADAHFKPRTLTAHEFAMSSDCADPLTTQSFTITNGTRRSYDITYKGSVVFTIPKKSIEDICVSGTGTRLKLGISGSTHVLVVTLTTT